MWLFLQDIAISVTFALALFAGGIANAVYSSDNADTHDESCRRTFNNNQEKACDNLETASRSEGATAVSYSVIYIYIYSYYLK